MRRYSLFKLACLTALLALLLGLTACGPADNSVEGSPSDSSEDPAPVESPVDEDSNLEGTGDTLESLCGADYQSYIVETITMQMENRMEKTPEVIYYPIEEGKPLTDYVSIDETTPFTLNEDGNIVIAFPAGTITDALNGEQSFIVPLP